VRAELLKLLMSARWQLTKIKRGALEPA